ncbi:MAG TPA: acyltransferase, partial [Verrucomicrobiae bacterium]
QSWSLAVEEQFYLAFGLLLFFARQRWVVGVITAALAVKFLVYETCGAVDADSTLWRVVFSYREPILFGVLAAFALNQRWWFELFQRGLNSTVAIPLLGLTMAAWLCVHLMRHESFADAQLLYLLMMLTVISLVVRPVTPLIDSRFMVHIGKISYGIYLLHMFVISAVRKLPGGNTPALCFLFSSVAVIIMASLVYKYFEQPIITFYKRKFSPLNAAVAHPSMAREKLPMDSTGPAIRQDPVSI